jgi:hypothetical protein
VLFVNGSSAQALVESMFDDSQVGTLPEASKLDRTLPLDSFLQLALIDFPVSTATALPI